ncbi:MAG: hypothetical protein ABSG64_04320 [Solirubrobacteraceae bacterium]|jgi:hypothetical protein
MRQARTSLAALLLLAGAVLSACGSSTGPNPPPNFKIEHVAGSSTGRIVLTALGAQRDGIQTVPVAAASGGPTVVIPYGALIYAPSGATYAFTSPAPLTFTEVSITVDYISGSSAYLFHGPPVGTKVVSVGAEELYGVQTGVLAQT